MINLAILRSQPNLIKSDNGVTPNMHCVCCAYQGHRYGLSGGTQMELNPFGIKCDGIKHYKTSYVLRKKY